MADIPYVQLYHVWNSTHVYLQVGHINIVSSSREEGRRKLANIDPSAVAALDRSAEALTRAVAAEAASTSGSSSSSPVQVN